jgi:hypothetical protein
MAKNIRFAEIAESFLTWNEGKTRIAQCVMMGNISHSETINKSQKKSKGSLTQINAASVLQYQEREKRHHDRISTLLNVHLNKDVKYQGAYNRNNQRRE